MKLLIVEDDTDIRETMRELLLDRGHDVLCAENGAEALDMLRASRPLPSVILLDLTMPVMDGFTFRVEQQADPAIANVPVIVMTADGHIDEKRTRIGTEHALKKPMSIDALFAMLDQFA